MNENDRTWLQEALASVGAGEKVGVSKGRANFTLHRPSIEPGEACDFEIHGQRRQRVGDDRRWRTSRYAIAKILRAEKGRLVLQDIFGSVLVFGEARPERDEEQADGRGGKETE